jgi:hypothetical protein
MKQYYVSWHIDIYADTPQEAARKALEIQRNPDSTATVFEVRDEAEGRTTTVDLLTEEMDMNEEE